MKVLTVLVAGALAGCATLQQIASFQEPQFDVQRVELTGLGLQGGSFNLVLDVFNPNAYDLPATSLEVDIALEETPFGTVALDNPPTLPGEEHATVVLPVRFNWTGVGAGARAILTRGAVGYGVDTKIGVDTPLGLQTVNAHLDGEAPIRDLLR